MLISVGALVLGVFCLVDAAFRPAQAYQASGKLNKTAWLIILGLAVAWSLLGRGGSFGIIGLIGLVATIVYLVDVRPALRAVGGGRPRGGSSSAPW